MSGFFTIKKSGIVGWYFEPQAAPGACVDVYCGDIFVRRLRCVLAWPAPPASAAAPGPCGFALNITDQLAELLPADAQFTVVKPDGELLQRNGEAMALGLATDGGAVLRDRLEQGWIVDKWGSLKLPFQAVEGLDQKYMDFYCDISGKLESELGIDFYLAYGALLGCVRDGKLIPSDDDVDAAYVSKYSDVKDVAREFHDIKKSIQSLSPKYGIKLGVVETGQMSVVAGDMHFDIFTSWIDTQKRYNCYFGISGPLDGATLPLKTHRFLGHDVRIPVETEQVLEWTYGPGWKTPDPHFFWAPAKSVNEIMEELRAAGREIVAEA